MPETQEIQFTDYANHNAPTIQTEAAATPERSIMERSVLLEVSVSRFGLKRKLAKSKVQVDADKTYIHASKDLLQSKAYSAIVKKDGEFRDWLMTKCLPSMFKKGIYLVPIVSVTEVEAGLSNYMHVERPELVNRFIEDYPARREEAEGKLAGCFDAGQYPAVETVRACFSVTKRYLTFSTPDKLKSIDPTLYTEESDRLRETFVSAQGEIREVLRAGFSEVVSHMVAKLSPDATGKRQIFRDTLVGNVREFIDNFAAKNIVDDAELAALVDKARGILDGVSPDLLRDHRTVRDTVRDEMGGIKAALDGMLQDAPTRKINFDTED